MQDFVNGVVVFLEVCVPASLLVLVRIPVAASGCAKDFKHLGEVSWPDILVDKLVRSSRRQHQVKEGVRREVRLLLYLEPRNYS